jgi:uncharacterized surface protein with fasciclin (FAS1) repeats
MKKLTLTALFLVAMFALTGCSEDNNPTSVTGADKVKPSERITIVDVASGINADSGEFSTLIAAVVAADLVGALSGNGQLTVFAPTDEAFGKLGLDADNIATELDKAALTNILLYHVAKGKRMAEDVISSSQIRMLNGARTTIDVNDEGAFINESLIVATDVPADNGVIHVIDTVLLP